MKRTLLFLAASFVIGATAQAADFAQVTAPGDNLIINSTAMSPVIFIERGVEFLVYPNGTLDFNVTPSSTRMNGKYVKQVYYAGNHNVDYKTGANYRKGYVQYNRSGQVIQIGTLTIDYLRNGQVSRIGAIPVKYKKGRLDQIGNAKMHYDRSGRIYKQTGNLSNGKDKIDLNIKVIEVYGDRSRR
ncbi:hypothetical protein QO206_06885 [Leeuwenhoekiella aequorea]|uniref:hypothetical protein n=1 Tax=Leeuwenhoekiella aequorea TaxID=283736 RepID=UPI00352E27F4|tara:strand:+ start:2820 stop:3377 length:558 start_codon:yes stop_codon:yes gene_type:complete